MHQSLYFLVGFFGDTNWNLPPKSATLCMPKLAESESPEITFVLGVYAKKWYDRKILPKNNGWCVIFNNQDIEHANILLNFSKFILYFCPFTEFHIDKLDLIFFFFIKSIFNKMFIWKGFLLRMKTAKNIEIFRCKIDESIRLSLNNLSEKRFFSLSNQFAFQLMFR